MHNNIEVQTDSVEVQQGTAAEISTEVVLAEVVEQQIVEVTPHRFVISSDGLYSSGGSDVGNTPQWLADAIQAEVTSGNADLSTIVTDLSIYTQNLNDHVNQEIIRLDNEDLRQDGLITTVKSELDGDIAAINTSLLTKVTGVESTALATNVVATEFGGAGGVVANSFFINNISSYSSDIDSHTTSIDAMYSSIADPTTGLVATSTAVSSLYTYTGVNPLDGTISATAGLFTDLRAGVGDVSLAFTSQDTVTVDGTDWSVGSSKLATLPNGALAGWSMFADGLSPSEFIVSSDTFKVVSPTQSVTALAPFSVDTATGKSTFNGIVDFTNTNLSGGYAGTTTINGGLLETGSLSATKITATDAWVGGWVKSANYSWNAGTPAGFGMFSVGETDSGQAYNIVGGKIYGGAIVGSTLSGTTVTTSDLVVLTDAGLPTTLAVSKLVTFDDTITYVECFLGFYPYNATTAVDDGRAVSLSGTGLNVAGGPMSAPAGYILLASVTDANTDVKAQIQIMRGGTVVSTEALPVNNPPSGTTIYFDSVYGFRLAYHYEGTTASLGISPYSVLSNLAGDGEISIRVYLGVWVGYVLWKDAVAPTNPVGVTLFNI